MLSKVIEADCFDVMTNWEECQADLVYLDPPFNTGKTQCTCNYEFSDSMPDGVYFKSFMEPRLKLIHKVLKPNGAILLHCDWRTVHRQRMMLDEIFGQENFVNHLIWTYGLGGSSPRKFARKHDDILYYAKGPDYYFDPPMVSATSQRMKGMLKKATDVIDNIPSLNNIAKERVGYPTQKPLRLLTMLIEACCPPSGMVVDPFCGSGTTLVAAKRSGRSCIGIDTNPDAVAITNCRLKEASLF